jgi:hypothetical protein
VTIPSAGWQSLRQFDSLQKGVETANLPEAAVLLWSYPPGTEFLVYGDACRSHSTAPDNPALAAEQIAAGLAAQADRDASEPEHVTVGGYEGRSITLHVPDEAEFGECEGGVFATYGTNADASARTQQGPGQRDELWILDVQGAIVIIDAMYRADTSSQLIGEMRAIAESATFDTP